jgi:hypothetical protein
MRSFQSLAMLARVAIERGAKTADQVGQGVFEIPVLAFAEAVPSHVDVAAETTFLRIESGNLRAFFWRQEIFDDGAAIAAELLR